MKRDASTDGWPIDVVLEGWSQDNAKRNGMVCDDVGWQGNLRRFVDIAPRSFRGPCELGAAT
jgi:hypothetical protein